MTETQRQAVKLLADGLNDTEVAKAIGIRPSLVATWRTFDREFKLALNERRRNKDSVQAEVIEQAEAPATDPAEELREGGEKQPAEPMTSSTDGTEQAAQVEAQPMVTTRMASFS